MRPSRALRLLLLAPACAAALGAQPRTRNVVLIVTDGLRWQEVFRGAEGALISRSPGGVEDTAALRRDFWRDTPQARREALLPFLWGTVARQGLVLGDRDAGSEVNLVNTMRFSYPGYNELFTGTFDPRIDSNDYPPNPNETVFEWLAGQPAYAGKVGAVATWDAFRRILNRDRARFPVMDGWDPPFARAAPRTARMAWVDELYATMVRVWPGNAFDAPMHQAARAFIDATRPRVLFVGYGETDEWAHTGRYDLLLRSAHQVDAFIADLWRTMQALPEYRDRTTFVITTDHGRGSGPTGWRDHGRDVEGAQHLWMAVLGPDTPALGVVQTGGTPATQSQVAATLAALLGEDWGARHPNAGKPLRQALGR